MRDPHVPANIRIAKDGTWFYEGAEMFRREIVHFFYQYLKIDSDGNYLIEMPGDPGDRCYVEVEDTAFVVQAVEGVRPLPAGEEGLFIRLSDDTEEALDPESLQTGADNILYCSVRGGLFRARFSRAGYYQLARYIDYDEPRGAFFLSLNGERYYIRQRSTNA
jgi:hypothetical protein